MSQHTGSHKNSLNLLGEKYLNESHWPMRRIRLLECINLLITTNSLKSVSHLLDRSNYRYCSFNLAFNSPVNFISFI